MTTIEAAIAAVEKHRNFLIDAADEWETELGAAHEATVALSSAAVAADDLLTLLLSLKSYAELAQC